MPDRPVLFLPECHADTALVRFLLPDPLLSVHTQGCPEVARTMLSPRAKEYSLIGIVDNDKKLNIHCKGFFRAFELVEQHEKLTVRKHPHTNQHLIIVDKAAESFLLWNADSVGISVEAYGFHTTVKPFGIQLKTPSIETDPNYLQLLADLRTQQAPGLLTFERLLHGFLLTP